MSTKVRTARRAGQAKNANPAIISTTAAVLPVSGTEGSALGTSRPMSPNDTTALTSTTCSTINCATACGRRRAGSADSASSAAPPVARRRLPRR